MPRPADLVHMLMPQVELSSYLCAAQWPVGLKDRQDIVG